ncbi:50S ribosomal protein L4 [Geobacter sulfurreducens]|uniref:Large ribosomal subunit protein uL4 n=1 Tax=Geobacter sulfurreducens (strain ATCC 51573 / DSM 12127 / PCA) TaxID=243231 RepID=RL4_GEOSL|nr:50S ribosomal protein L4 [Geobacter sulfurreducens]P61063.1 RecName: Full=Large ribosomal subunit protein uL4; AltName: Full=50S ribosomal protein L4 [Geobacter sulfurreducens PCA]AAR36249.1 ribosomal protein L4 [Geobacter sulfurreducens PCA]ADI85610.1 ribosomal protein L4 [Geobacter sulfurreducens KN400]AJY69124.1 50S ribosomal protein L4 [Geobacter sulfurreducens]QVW34672.1 50S ribosomal protein L4 [Geobacter sulfurreducens]UAC03541.1 50S ribosomal protein L4 [Geobacter sulfurreducens]
MATIDVFDISKNKVGVMDLNDNVFNGEVKEYLIHEAIKVQLANRRAGTVSVKNRAIVSGGGKKPYRQKGTGQARQGCIRAPHFVGGGVAFGPRPKVYNLSMNKKARKAAVRSALSMLYKENKLSVLDSFTLPSISTKGFVTVLKAFDLAKTLVVVDEPNLNLELSARNVKDVKVLKAEHLNVFDIVKYNNIIVTQSAVRTIEGVLQS